MSGVNQSLWRQYLSDSIDDQTIVNYADWLEKECESLQEIKVDLTKERDQSRLDLETARKESADERSERANLLNQLAAKDREIAELLELISDMDDVLTENRGVLLYHTQLLPSDIDDLRDRVAALSPASGAGSEGV